MNSLVSIIVPVYNSKKYIQYCINSLLNQTYRNIEVILVDDGSSDGSSEICDRVSKSDLRVKVIHQKNQGVCITRNNGILASEGKYITFCDNDDWLPTDAIEKLVYSLEKSDADLVCGGIKLVWPHTNSFELLENKTIIKKCDYEDLEYLNGIGSSAWGRIYKKDLIINQNIFFGEEKTREDSIFFYKYLSECKKVLTIQDIVYCYNKLENDTGCTKSHLDYGKCSYINYMFYKDALLSFANNIEDINKLTAEKANYHLIDSVYNYLTSDFLDNDKETLIHDTYTIFENDISIDNLCVKSKEILKFDITDLITKNRLKDILKTFYDLRINRLKYIKERIKHILYLVKSKKYKKTFWSK